MNEQLKYTAKTLAGLESLLEKELQDLACTDIKPITRGFTFLANEEQMYALNYNSRFSVKVLQELYRFSFKTKDDYLAGIQKYDWDYFIKADESISVDSTVIACPLFDNSLYTSQLTKDGIVDFFRNKYGMRPSVRTNFPDLRISIYISGFDCIVLVDTSGSSLHKRGYRKALHAAPINEVLAAGLIALSEWKFDCDFYDPMCGSGTIIIEAAMAAMNIPGGYFRGDFGFMHWQNFKPALFEKVKTESNAKIREFDYRIIGSDYSDDVLISAKANIFAAGLKLDIELENNNAFSTQIPPNSMVIFNPPYDERLSLENSGDFYKKLGDL